MAWQDYREEVELGGQHPVLVAMCVKHDDPLVPAPTVPVLGGAQPAPAVVA